MSEERLMRLRRKNSTVRRGYLREAPLKKRGFKKLAVDCKKILEVLREEGPCGYGKLKEKTKIPKGTLDRRLSFLKNLGQLSYNLLFEKCSSLLEEIQDIETEITGETWEKFAKELPDIQSAELEEELSAERTNNIYKKSESTSILTEEERFKLDKQTHEARMELEDQLTKIIWKVVNGEPLSGRCNQCPEVDIGKKSESLHKDSRARD